MGENQHQRQGGDSPTMLHDFPGSFRALDVTAGGALLSTTALLAKRTRSVPSFEHVENWEFTWFIGMSDMGLTTRGTQRKRHMHDTT